MPCRSSIVEEYPVRACPVLLSTLGQSTGVVYTVDGPRIRHPPDLGKPVALRTCPISGPHANKCGSASVAAKPLYFEDLSDLRTANYISAMSKHLTPGIGDPGSETRDRRPGIGDLGSESRDWRPGGHPKFCPYASVLMAPLPLAETPSTCLNPKP
jgi:hypothetical protein